MIHLNTNKIIITTDFSETSYLAIKHGAFLAQYTKGEIYLVHVITKHWEKFNVFTPSITIENVDFTFKVMDRFSKMTERDLVLVVVCGGDAHGRQPLRPANCRVGMK